MTKESVGAQGIWAVTGEGGGSCMEECLGVCAWGVRRHMIATWSRGGWLGFLELLSNWVFSCS